MFALRSGRNRKAGATGPALFGFSFSNEGFVVPRLLRRPVRLFARLTDGDFVPPRFSATIMTTAFMAATGLYGAYVGGHMPALVQAVTAHSGFAVDQVRVTGHRETSEIDVLDRLDLQQERAGRDRDDHIVHAVPVPSRFRAGNEVPARHPHLVVVDQNLVCGLGTRHAVNQSSAALRGYGPSVPRSDPW